jgi:hypothetical protein
MGPDATMDLFDAFYVPYQGFKGQVLPGPRVQIYAHTCVKGASKAADIKKAAGRVHSP